MSLLILAENIVKYYGDRKIFSLENLKIYRGDKVGIVGENGAGKTTLMNILARESLPDEGEVRHFCPTSYIRQLWQEELKEYLEGKTLKEFRVPEAGANSLSGGEKTRLKIAGALEAGFLDDWVLFADEPTANLDKEGVALFVEKLSRFPSYVIISHDRELLSGCNKILAIQNGTVSVFSGNYEFYEKRLLEEQAQKEQAYEDYIKTKQGLERAAGRFAAFSAKAQKGQKRMGNSEARLQRGGRSERSKHMEKIKKNLLARVESLDVKEKPREAQKVKLDFSLTNPPENKVVIRGDKLSFSYGSRKILENADFYVNNGRKTALVGENGAGKTTLLNLIYADAPGVKTVPRAKLGYFRQDLENLDLELDVLQNAMKDSVQPEWAVRSILAGLLFDRDHLWKKGNVLSGGERVRLSLAKLMVSDANVLLLDEPTNYLDIASIKALTELMQGYEGTVLFVSHDPDFSKLADNVIALENRKTLLFEGGLPAYDEHKSQENSGKPKGAAGKSAEMELMMIEMNMSRLAFEMSGSKANRDALAQEYEELAKRARELKK